MSRKPKSFRPAHLPSVEDARRDYDASRRQKPWRRWYSTAAWQEIRRAQLDSEPLCANCRRHGRLTPATVCDHIDPHRGDPVKFWNGPFQSLCDAPPWRCHSSDKQRQERAHLN